AQAMRDVEEVRRGVAGPLCSLALDAVLVPMLLLLLAWFHWAFGVLAAAFAALALLLGLAAERLTRQALAESNQAAARGAALVADAVRCAEAVEAMGLMPALVRRWAVEIGRGAEQLRRAPAGARAATAAAATLYGLASGGALVVGALLITNGSPIGYGLVAALLLTTRIMEPFSRLGAVLEEAAAARAAWRRLDLLLSEADAAPAPETRAYPCPEGRLQVERVTLVQPGAGRALLREVDLTLSPGEVVALVGPPGSGKSTLLRIILGLRRPTAGEVFLDGHATAHWDREDLARHIGYLPQDPLLTGGTVAEAIARLAERPDMRAVLRAAQLAGADRMVAGLPQGFATRIQGGDVRLSMGQRQRIALARAVYGTPRIVLLDEPAAYLDAEGEAAVARMMAALAEAGAAVLFTSHREGLLRAAGRVVALREGGLLVPATLGAPRRRLPQGSGTTGTPGAPAALPAAESGASLPAAPAAGAPRVAA
ncbi:MAG: ATP-binding cassette domain-containing protein, partial [Acetobacteraceae bacterium]|nr:ATP-binding cassette domain-containing protein [Acetobacteraceae bacterium]